jgi:hypothetical protein
MALMPQRTRATVPSTLASNRAAALVDFPPPCLQRAQSGKGSVPLGLPAASGSPVGGKGRLVPTTWVSLLMAEMVEAPARMPAHNWASTPSHGGREGINGSNVSHCPEANCRIASFVYYFNCRNRKKYTETINHVSGTIFIAFSSGRTTQWQHRLSPLIVGDSRYSAAEPKAR